MTVLNIKNLFALDSPCPGQEIIILTHLYHYVLLEPICKAKRNPHWNTMLYDLTLLMGLSRQSSTNQRPAISRLPELYCIGFIIYIII